MPNPPEKSVMCVFIIRGEEAFRQEMIHPGMDAFVMDWIEEPKTETTPEKRASGRFYWDHMDGHGHQIFRLCDGYRGEKFAVQN